MPVKPLGHLQKYLDPWEIQVPEFIQGMLRQISSNKYATLLFISHKVPVKVGQN
jgi:hypothetical protein